MRTMLMVIVNMVVAMLIAGTPGKGDWTDVVALMFISIAALNFMSLGERKAVESRKEAC